jgi:mRNA interferase RelE/StbE
MRRVILLAGAAKALGKLPAAERQRNASKLGAYAADPSALASSVKALSGQPEWRLRIGDYRAIFRLDGDTVVVTKIGHRRDVYE